MKCARSNQQDTPQVTASSRRIAVLVPCYNEETAIKQVIEQFRAALPGVSIHVYDNNSKDGTRDVARAAGAIVGNEVRQGKGHVVRRMFADVEADIYLLVDGDATYDAPSAPKMIAKLIGENLDMVVGCRVDQEQDPTGPGIASAIASSPASSRRCSARAFTRHSFGLPGFFAALREIVSGTIRQDLKSKPSLRYMRSSSACRSARCRHRISRGWKARSSKLNTWRDGFRILWTIFNLYRGERPLRFFGLLAIIFVMLSIVLATPVVVTFFEEGIVPRLPTAILAMGMMMLAFLSLASGLILDTVTRGRRELKRLAYLSHRAPYGVERRAD